MLFADVVESMKLAAALDPERLREIMHDLFNRAAAVVQRYQGTVDKFTGDGLMALFGAPAALEDHALRACLGGLEIQAAARALTDEVRERDHVELRVRIGLNSGEVVAGAVGAGPGRYTAIGHTVGLAQRMEAAAQPGAVLCTERTARLAGQSAVFGPVEPVHIKGSAEAVAACELRRVDSDRAVRGRDDGPMVGRDSELALLQAALERGDVTFTVVMGEPGQGKSRLIREFTAAAPESGVEIIEVRCESHTTHVPLHVLSRVLRALFGVRGLEPDLARSRIIEQLPSASDEADADILFDVLSIGDANRAPPMPSVDARRRRLVEVMTELAETRPARMLVVIEDLHWVDTASEEVLVKFAEALRRTESMLIGTLRPGRKRPVRAAADMAVVLSPLGTADTMTLAAGIIGTHPSAVGLSERIAEVAAGNPFFIEEIVRDLVGQGLLAGHRGDYRLAGEVESIAAPSTVQSVLAARIDRLSAEHKEILNAASVIGSGFDLDVLQTLLPTVEPAAIDGLVAAELIDQTQFLPVRRYEFRHPLVRSVAYGSQLVATRAATHRRLAAAIQAQNPAAVEQNSALIGGHLEAAEDLEAAYVWYVRSAAWFRQRDVVAARESWQRALLIADRLPADMPGVTDKRIAPRAQLNMSAWMVGGAEDDRRCFDELRLLTTQSGDPLQLALGMAGRVTSLIITDGLVTEAFALATELETLYDRIDGPPADRAEILTAVALAHYEAGQFERALQSIERLGELSGQLTGYDLAPPLAMGGVIKIAIGRRAEGRAELDNAIRLGQASDPVCFVIALGYELDLVVMGFERIGEALVCRTREALQQAEAFGDAYGLSIARWAHGTALLAGDPARHAEAVALLQQTRADGIDVTGSMLDAQLADEMHRRGKCGDEQIDPLYDCVASELDSGSLPFVGHAAAVLIRLLAGRGGARDISRAEDIATRLEAAVVAGDQALQLWPMYCRMVLAQATGDVDGYECCRDAYHRLARRLDARAHRTSGRPPGALGICANGDEPATDDQHHAQIQE